MIRRGYAINKPTANENHCGMVLKIALVVAENEGVVKKDVPLSIMWIL